MELPDQTYNEMLRRELTGRILRADDMPRAHQGRPMYAFWGEELGFHGADVHSTRAYRLYVTYDEDNIIRDLELVIEGELISPCSGYFREPLDEFDYPALLDWCLKHTEQA